MKFDDTVLDAVKEIGNIGSGNATTALSDLLGSNVTMSVPTCGMIPFQGIADLFGGPETVVTAVLVQMSGGLNGYVMLVQQLEDSVDMLEALLGAQVDPTKQNIEQLRQQFAPLEEVGNILIGAYLSAISSMTGLSIVPSVPMLSVDMAMAVMSLPALVYGELGDQVLLLDTEFRSDAKRVKGRFFLVPDLPSYDQLMKTLNIQ